MQQGRTGTAGLAEDLAKERRAVAARCPPYDRALALLPPLLEGRLGRLLEAAWGERTFHAHYDRPLLLLAALRADARAEGPAHPLYEAFAAPAPRAEAVTPAALAAALDPARDRVWDALVRRAVQTNETSRAVAWLWPAALAAASEGARPLALADVGASAGLNLVADALPPPWTFEGGAPVDVARAVHAVARLGLDSSPLDVARAEDSDWLRACVWPGDAARAGRLEEALRAFAAARPRPDAPVLLPILARNVPARLDLLASTEPGALVLAYQTVVRDYLPPEERAEYEAGMREWLATHPAGRALWVELEGGRDPASPDLACALVAHVRAPGGEVRDLALARCGYHPAVLRPDPPAVAELRALAGAGANAGQEVPLYTPS
jgi:hypothetical protein